ncbi:MAG TPA: glycosyltransferase [Solirubrobacterales bacterium]
MSAAKPDLVMFTGTFPHGGEAVLGAEIAVTAVHFERVFLIPSHPGPKTEELPANVELVHLWRRADRSRTAKRGAVRTALALEILGRTLRHPSNWRSYAASARFYLDVLAEGLLRAMALRAWVEENGLGDAVFYDFWFENSTLALAVLRRLGTIRCAVSRAHGFDVFDSRWGGKGRVPFREFKAENLDAVFAVSEDGARYLQGKFGPHAGKVRLSRLGIPASPGVPEGAADPPLVVSCSALRPDKQVRAIPEVLRACDRPLRWVHFGDGPERRRVEEAAAALPARVTWELRGTIENAAVRRFYATEPVSAFLSMSRAEGVPISMMEAQSAGIPIVALSVGGVPEIVAPETGVLLAPDAEPGTAAAALGMAVAPASFDHERIRAAFASRYEAAANYRGFASALLEAWSTAGSAAHAE